MECHVPGRFLDDLQGQPYVSLLDNPDPAPKEEPPKVSKQKRRNFPAKIVYSLFKGTVLGLWT